MLEEVSLEGVGVEVEVRVAEAVGSPGSSSTGPVGFSGGHRNAQ